MNQDVMSEDAIFALLDGLMEETIGGIPEGSGPLPTREEMAAGGRHMEREFADLGIAHETWVMWSERDAERTLDLIVKLSGGFISEDVIKGIFATQLTQGFLMGVALMKWKTDQGGAA